MPVIELRGNAEDPGWVFALMLFPNDNELREQMFAMRRTEFQLSSMHPGAKLQVDAKTLRRLVDAPSKEEMGRLVAEATKRATYAGDILTTIYLMDRFKDQCSVFDRPSINKAIAICKEFGLMNRFGDGDKMYYSEQKIRNCWEEFKSVAHLWAAFRINKDYPFQDERGALRSTDGLQTFLSVARGIYEFGITFVPKATKPPLPILHGADIWTVPAPIPAMTLHSNRVPDRLAEYVAKYRA